MVKHKKGQTPPGHKPKPRQKKAKATGTGAGAVAAAPEDTEEKNIAATLEDSLTETAQSFQAHKTFLIVVAIAAVSVVGLYYAYNNVKASQAEARAMKVEQAFDGEPSQIRLEVAELLDDVKGDAIEPYVASRYSQWLAADGEDRDEAIRVARDALSRHPDDVYLSLTLQNLEAVVADDANFTVPEPPIPEGPIEGGTATEETSAGSTSTTESELGVTGTVEVVVPESSDENPTPSDEATPTTQPGDGE